MLIHTTPNDSDKIIASRDLAKYYFYQDHDSALKYFDSALAIITRNTTNPDGPKNEALVKLEYVTLNGKGVLFYYKGGYEEASKLYFEALKLAELQNDSSEMLAILLNIASIKESQGKFEPALEYYEQSKLLAEQIKDTTGLFYVLVNMGSSYYNQGVVFEATDKTAAILKWKQAILSFKESLLLAGSTGNKIVRANALYGLGNVYNKLDSLDQAFDFLQQAHILNKEIKYNTGIAFDLVLFANLYHKAGKSRTAIEFGERAFKIGREIEEKKLVMNAARILSKAYEKTGQIGLALKHYKKFKIIEDSLSNEELSNQILRDEMDYKTEKKKLKSLCWKKRNNFRYSNLKTLTNRY